MDGGGKQSQGGVSNCPRNLLTEMFIDPYIHPKFFGTSKKNPTLIQNVPLSNDVVSWLDNHEMFSISGQKVEFFLWPSDFHESHHQPVSNTRNTEMLWSD